jgi:hypothetical protein
MVALTWLPYPVRCPMTALLGGISALALWVLSTGYALGSEDPYERAGHTWGIDPDLGARDLYCGKWWPPLDDQP